MQEFVVYAFYLHRNIAIDDKNEYAQAESDNWRENEERKMDNWDNQSKYNNPEWDDEIIDEAFDENPDNTWNVD